MDTKTKGDISELEITLTLLKLGCVISVPYGDNARYDMIMDYDGKLYKVQCKTGLWDKKCGSIKFRTKSVNYYSHKQYTAEEIDFFGVYCPHTNKCYLVPIDHVPKGECALRVRPPGNNQTTGIRWAKTYEI